MAGREAQKVLRGRKEPGWKETRRQQRRKGHSRSSEK